MSTRVLDPYTGAPGRGWLHGLNPLAKLAAPLPAIAVLVFTRDLWTPTVFLGVAYLVILSGSRGSRLVALLLGGVLPAVVIALGLGMSVWVDPGRVADTPALVTIGGWAWRAGALQIGAATSIRLVAIVALALIAGLTSTGPDFVRAAVQQLRIPYRFGYAALAALRFVPRFGHELDVIRQAHRVRGAHAGRGPFAAVARWWGYIVPLLAGAIRHAERVALAMDARAFGAHPDRTERHEVPWRARDTVFVAAFWAVSIALLAALYPWAV